jgi:HSP20 family protein
MSPQFREAKEGQTMTYLTRFDPYREIGTLQERFNQLFGGTGRRDREEELSLGAWIPPVDIEEDKERIVLTAELPGMKENDIDIQMEGGVLTIRGERKFENEKEGKNYHRVERSYGQFVRSFTLPNNVDRENIGAEFKDGLLHIELPKREEAKPRQIKIGGNGQTSKPETVSVKAK